MLTDTDWRNEPVIHYQLTFIISISFIPGLEDTNSDIYRWHNETLSRLVSTADSGSTDHGPHGVVLEICYLAFDRFCTASKKWCLYWSCSNRLNPAKSNVKLVVCCQCMPMTKQLLLLTCFLTFKLTCNVNFNF